MLKKRRNIEIIENQQCPVCGKNEAVYSEYEIEDPYAGTIYILSLKCNACGYRRSDLELENSSEPAIYELVVENKDDLNIRVVKSGECEIKIPEMGISVDSTFNGEHFVSNVEGVLVRFREQLEFLESEETNKKIVEKINSFIDKINSVINGEEKIKLILKDKSGNSTIISNKVKIKKLKK